VGLYTSYRRVKIVLYRPAVCCSQALRRRFPDDTPSVVALNIHYIWKTHDYKEAAAKNLGTASESERRNNIKKNIPSLECMERVKGEGNIEEHSPGAGRYVPSQRGAMLMKETPRLQSERLHCKHGPP
jgi:hypothetical protein